MYCANCGHRNAPDARRCTNCGSYELREKEVKNRSCVGALLGFFLGLIGIGLAGLVLYPESRFERKSCLNAAIRAWGVFILLACGIVLFKTCATGSLLWLFTLLGAQ